MEIITIPILCGELPKFLGAICYEGDKNVRRLEFTGAQPDLQYKLDMERLSDGMKNVVELENRGGTLVLVMDGSVHIPAGRYHVQLRTVGETVCHSNKAFLTVRESIGAVDSFSALVPTEMEQMEKRLTELYNHPPVPGDGGKWLVWDLAENMYVESQYSCDVKKPIRGEDYWTDDDIAEIKGYVDEAILGGKW